MIPTDTDFEAKVTYEISATPIPEDPPFYALFMGDYSGMSNNSEFIGETVTFQPIEIDRDNFEEVMKSLNVRLFLDLNNSAEDIIALNFESLDDFHPDKIVEKVTLFSDLLEIRKRLLDHNTYESAAREVRSWFESTEETLTSAENVVAESTDLLDDILTSQTKSADQYKVDKSSVNIDIKRFISFITKPFVINTDENEQAELIKFVDNSISELLIKILHHPDFKALESAWRGLDFVLRRVESNSLLKFFILDISKQKLGEDLKSSDDLLNTNFYKKLVIERSENNLEPWAVVCSNFSFDFAIDDTTAIIRFSKICNQISAPLILGINSQNVAYKDFNNVQDLIYQLKETSSQKLWSTLKSLPESESVCLATPEILARLPYGNDTEPVSKFDFEELDSSNEKLDNYLWFNPSYICGLLILKTFSLNGWSFSKQFINEVTGLPFHTYKTDNSTKIQPSSRFSLSDNFAQTLSDENFSVFLSSKYSDELILYSLKSISGNKLKSRWT